MIYKFLQLLKRFKGIAAFISNLWDLSEPLSYPWQTQELYFIIAVISWLGILRFSLFLFLQFDRLFPYLFNKRSVEFMLWFLYTTLALIGVSNLVFNYLDHRPVEMLYFKSILTVAALVYDWKETKEAIQKYKATMHK